MNWRRTGTQRLGREIRSRAQCWPRQPTCDRMYQASWPQLLGIRNPWERWLLPSSERPHPGTTACCTENKNRDSHSTGMVETKSPLFSAQVTSADLPFSRSHPGSHYTALDSRRKCRGCSLQRQGSERIQCHFHCTLQVRVNHRESPGQLSEQTRPIPNRKGCKGVVTMFNLPPESSTIVFFLRLN